MNQVMSEDDQSISLFDNESQSDILKSITFFEDSHNDTADLSPSPVKQAPILTSSEIDNSIDLPPPAKSKKIDSHQCRICQLPFDKLSFFAIHNRMNHQQSSNYTCPQCQATCVSLNDLTTHCQRHQVKTMNCPHCHVDFLDCRVYQMHLSIHLIELENSMIENVAPSQANENEEDLGNDYVNMMQRLDQMFAEFVYLLKYTLQVDSFPCPICGIHFTSRLRLGLHKNCCHRQSTKITAQ